MGSIFKIEILKKLENAILRLVFANTAFYQRAMLLIIYAKYAESLLGIRSYTKFTLGPPRLDQDKIFKVYISERLENAV